MNDQSGFVGQNEKIRQLCVFFFFFLFVWESGIEKFIKLLTWLKFGLLCTEWKEKSVAVTNEFYIFEMYVKSLHVKLTLILNFKAKRKKFVALHSTHHEGKTFPRNHRSQLNSSFEKWQHCGRVLTATLWFWIRFR